MNILCLMPLSALGLAILQGGDAADTAALVPVRDAVYTPRSEGITGGTAVYMPAPEPGGYIAVNEDSPNEEGFFRYFTPSSGWDSPLRGRLERSLSFVRYRQRGYDGRNMFGNNLFLYAGGRESLLQRYTDLSDGVTLWDIASTLHTLESTEAGGKFSISSGNGAYSKRMAYGIRFFRDDISFSPSLYIRRSSGENGYIKGLEMSQVDIAAGLDKRTSKGILSFKYAGGYGRRDVRSATTQEVYTLSGDNYFNPNYGEQNGEGRNARYRDNARSAFVLSYSGKSSNEVISSASVSAVSGRDSYSLPMWYGAATPYPDYYRYLPSFFGNSAVSGELTRRWEEEDPSVSQIEWARMYESNLFSGDATGVRRSHYIIRDMVTDRLSVDGIARIEYPLNDKFKIEAGAGGGVYRSSNYSRVADLMGGDYWLDIDQYLLDDEYSGDMLENNVRTPGRKVTEGERFGYDYDITTSSVNAEAGVVYSSKRWNIRTGVSLGRVTHTRKGNYEKENFSGKASFGESRPAAIDEYSLRLSASRFFALNHSVGVTLLSAAIAPYGSDIFVSPQYRNKLLPEICALRVSSAEAYYEYISPRFSIGAKGYFTRLGDESSATGYYDDIARQYADLIITGIDKEYAGVEFSASVPLTPSLLLSVEAALSGNLYSADPRIDIMRNSNGEAILTGSTSHLKGFRTGGSPQQAAILRIDYRLRAGWRFALAGNYAGANYVALNPVRRMSRVINLAGSPEILNEITSQERFPDAFTADLSLGRDFNVRLMGRVSLWLGVFNLLNNRDIKYGGYEQMRFSRVSAQAGGTLIPFKPKFYYAYGTTLYFNANLYFR